MMLACQSCTNSHEAGCKTGGGARVQGWLRHPETEPGNHSSREPLPGAGHPARDLPTPAHPSPTLQAWAVEEARSDLPSWLCAARSPAYPSPPGRDTHCGGQPRCQGHFQVPLQPQQCRHQDEDLCHLLEDFPVLQGENRSQEFQCPEGLAARLNR